MSDFHAGDVAITSLTELEVTQLQNFLMETGYNPGAIDGLWGPQTKAAWNLFAGNNGLEIDAINGGVWHSIAGEGEKTFVEGPGGEPVGNTTDGTGAGDGALSQEELDLIREDYPTLAYLLDEPIIGQLLRDAVRESWSSDKLVSKMEATAWWQTTSASQRTFDASMVRDPATIQQKIDTQVLLLENTFAAYGVSISDSELQDYAFDVVRNGTSDQGVLRIVGTAARAMMAGDQGGNDTFGGDASGQLASIVQSLQAEARAYHLGFNVNSLEEMAVKVMEGTMTRDGASANFRRQAQQAYPTLAPNIEQGQTIEEYFAPTKNRLAQVLDINPNQIDLTNDRWSGVTQFVDDNGNMRPMSYSEIGQWGRNQPEWWSTDEANDRTYGTLNKLLRTMGEV